MQKKMRIFGNRVLSLILVFCMCIGIMITDDVSVYAASNDTSNNDSVVFYDISDSSYVEGSGLDSLLNTTMNTVSSENEIMMLSADDIGSETYDIMPLADDGSIFHLDLGTSGDQRETKLHDNTYFEMDKYLEQTVDEINNQNTYEVYLEQALIDEDHPDVEENPAPNSYRVILIIDQSSSMASDTRINGMNKATAAFFAKIKKMNDKRLEQARNGEYTDIDPNGDVEAQMADHMIRVSGIIGYNNHIYRRYRNVSGLPVTSDTAVNTLASAAKLKNDLSAYLAGDSTADMQEMTRTDMAMAQAKDWVDEEGDPENSCVVLVTDGCPTLKDEYGWHMNLPLWGGSFNMSSKNANSSLSTARSMKDDGVIIESLYLGWGDSSLVAKAYETGNIQDVPSNDDCYGIMPIFLSLVSSDYPKNGTFGTSGERFNHTYTYENDVRNRFGDHTYLAKDTEKLLEFLEAIPAKIEAAGLKNVRTGYATASSVVQDVITMPFEKRAGYDIIVYKVPWIPANLGADGIPTDMNDKNEVQSFRWGEEFYMLDDENGVCEWVDITDEVSVSVNDGIVRVSGFDYEANAITNYDKDTLKAWPEDDALVYNEGDYGYKLIVVIPINAKITFGGNNIATNNEDTTQFYPSLPTGTEPTDDDYLPPWPQNTELNPDGNDYVEKYPVPRVDLNVSYDIVSDNMIVYAPQTAELRNLVTDNYNSLWYTDAAYHDTYTRAQVAETEYMEAEVAYLIQEQAYGQLENPTAADLKTLMDLEVDMTLKREIYEATLAELAEVADYTPDGIKNQFVDITYELKDPDGEVVGTMYIPHGKAYNDDIDWEFTDGPNTIIKKSGVYTVSATITPVDTTRSPGGLIYTELDNDYVKTTIGYSSLDYSSTGSTATGSQSAKTITQEPTAYLFYLKVTTIDSRLTPRQALDFNLGGELLLKSENLHLVDFEWVCTDGVTESISDNEPGITGLRKVGSGVTMISQIPEQAEDEGLVENIGGTVAATAPDGGYVPVSVILSRNVGNLNKSSNDQYSQTGVYMTDSDDIWSNGFNSVEWVHLCDTITDHDCNDEEFVDSQKYNTSENANGRGQVQYLIHILDNPQPKISKKTSTPAITKGEEIQWDVIVENNDLTENPERRSSVFSVVDVLPWVGDGRIDPNTNHEGSQFGGTLTYTSVVVDYTNSASALAAYENGTRLMYYTTDTASRTASEAQLLGTAQSGSIVWEKATGQIDGTSVSFGVPSNAVAIKLDTRLDWNESVNIDMTANMVNKDDQKAGDYYHNQAMTLNGNGARYSEVVPTVVTNLYLSGMVWEDADNNGIATATEKRLENVVVTLYQEHNPNNPNPVDRTVDDIDLSRAYDTNGRKYPELSTGADGSYKFDDIQPGTYYIVADYIPEEYAMTVKQAGVGNVNTEALDSEAEEIFVNDISKKESTSWITKVVVKDKGVPNQNYGLTLITGNIKVGKTLDEIYYPSSLSENERADYRVSFTFNLRNTADNTVYGKTVYMNEDNIHMKDGYPQIWAEFTDLPLGTYELTEVVTASYKLTNVTSNSTAVRFNKSTGVTTIQVTSEEHDFEVYVENMMNQDPPGGDENGVKNQINMRIPVSLDIVYVGDDPISSDTLTEYTFVKSDFSPAKGGDMIVTYDDGSIISLSDGTLDFADVQLEPATVTNDMNSGDDKITVTGYYAEKGRLLIDSYQVGVDLKPIHKFQLNFDANGSSFDNAATLNSVMFGYDENKGQNFVTMGTYKDVANGGLNELTNFHFGGWNTADNGTGTQYDDVSALNAIGKDSTISALTLYANWKAYITFDAQGGKITNGTTDDEKALVGKNSGNLSVSRNQMISTTLLAEKTNYDFVSWNTKKDGSGTNLEDYGPVTGPVTFYAIYYQREYYYTGNYQTFTAPLDGTYKVQLWGASGGGDWQSIGGKGGYVSGEIHLTAGTMLYVYVGAAGKSVDTDDESGTVYYFGGGAGAGEYGRNGTGGGATDIRTISGTWNNSNGLKSRIAVAGGGGGGGKWPQPSENFGGYAGGLVGGSAVSGKNGNSDGSSRGGQGGTQTSAGAKGGFGYGGISTWDGGGGGGGWYGGGAGNNKGYDGKGTSTSRYDYGGGGGSSYLSGYSGCISSYTGYVFSNGKVIAGNATITEPDGSKVTGHSGHGHARIELIDMD